MKLRNIGPLLIAVLLIGAGLVYRSYNSTTFHKSLIEKIQRNVERELEDADDEAKQLIDAQLDVSSPRWDEVKHFFMLADSNKVIAWNRTYFLPDATALAAKEEITFINSIRGDFLVRKWRRGSSTLYCILTLADRFPIINNFLGSEWNTSIFPVKGIRMFNSSSPAGDAIQWKGEVLFRILPEKTEVNESILSFLMMALGLALLLLSLIQFVRRLEKSINYDVAFVVLLAGLFAIRLGMIETGFPALYASSDVFDPKKFASSSLNASLGDLFFNAIALLIVVMYLFLNSRKFKTIAWTLQLVGFQRYIAGLAFLIICFLALIFPFDFIESIYHNSTLSLDITQSMSFDEVRIITVSAVLIGCITSFLFIHVFFSLANHLFEKQGAYFFIGLILAALIFIGQSYLLQRNLWATLALGIAFFTLLKLSSLNSSSFKVSFQLFIYLIISLSVYSFQNAWAVRLFYKERQVKDQVRFGKDFLTERDVLGEYLLDQVRHRVESDQFIQTRMASPFLSKSSVAEKIRRVYLNNYFDRYEIAIRTRTEAPSFLKDSPDVPDSTSVFLSRGFVPTGYPGIFYGNASDRNTVKRYHVRIPIFFQRPVGSVDLDLSLKRVIPDNVYPELLVDNRFNQIYRNRDFSYAVFNKGKLASSFGPFNYERDFQLQQISNPELYDKGMVDGKFYHVGIEDSNGTVAIVSADTYPWFYLITNFSFWFVLGLSLLFVAQGTAAIYSYLIGEKFNYTSRIQLVIFLAFLLPVLAVSITTLTLIGRSNEESITKDFLGRSLTVSQRISDLLSVDSIGTSATENLEKWIEENAAPSKEDISVYSPQGRLLATSQPALFDDQLISPLMDRTAWKKIALQQEVQTVTNEQLGKLQYSCAYSAILSPETGKLQAIVGLPFFESASFLQKSQALIISNILIVFVIVFIFFSILSFWASRSLTFPIRFITKSLGQTTFTGQNKPLQWNSTDEIGTLVKEYNLMVENLEASKRELAKSEKETAWREMAKQVAHEIKNPLTPMKLTLQQMEQALKTGALPMEKSQKSVHMLLKQVEILNQIASSFSSFANMPQLSPQEINVNTLLQGAVSLFAAETGVNVLYDVNESMPLVMIDPTSFSRAISNMIINAMQAKRDGQAVVEVNVTALAKPNSIQIAIRDNGKGIGKEDEGKIFQPHFTTKQSGSGLGLAMTKQIVTQAGGTIWFESVENQGTSFFIELPIAGA